MVLCCCHFPLLAIVDFHATSLPKSKQVGGIFQPLTKFWEVAKTVRTRDLAPKFGVFPRTAKLQSSNGMITVPGVRYQQGAGFSEGRDPLGYFPQKYSFRKAEVALWRGAGRS